MKHLCFRELHVSSPWSTAEEQASVVRVSPCYHGAHSLSNQALRLCQMTDDSLMFQGFELICFCVCLLLAGLSFNTLQTNILFKMYCMASVHVH